MDNLRLDVIFAWRTLSKNPLLSVLAILILALGIGATGVAFSFVDAFLLRPLPFAEPERLVHVWATDQRLGWDQARVSLPTFRDWQEQSTVFEGLAAFNYTEENLTGTGRAGEAPERIAAGRTSANVLAVLGVEPALGRGFLPGEDQPGAAPVALVSHRFWQQRLGGDAGALGRTLRFDDTEYTMVGVMPPEFLFPLPVTQVWLPRTLDAERFGRDQHFLQVVGRLRPGVTPAAAQVGMETVNARLRETWPELMEHRGVRVAPLRESLNFASEIIEPMSLVLLLASGFVLLIVCANLANLMLSRAVGRSREVSIRLAVGAERGRLIRQLLTESALLALAGGALGVLLANWGARWLDGLIPPDLYRVGSFELDAGGLAFALAASLASAVAFGLVPALRASGVHVLDGLAEGRSGTLGKKTHRLHGALVVAQIALALVLLAGCSLAIRSFDNIRRVDPGFEADRGLSMKMLLPSSRYDSDERIRAFHREVVDRVAALPGVEAAAFVDFLPLNHETRGATFTIEGRGEEETPRTSVVEVTSDYFGVMGIPVLQGRAFGAGDADGPDPVIVNQATASRYWPDGGAVGQRLRLAEEGRDLTVVGVVADSRHSGLDDHGLVQLYLPQVRDPGRYLRLLVRGAADPGALVDGVRREVWSVDPRLPVTEVRTLAAVVEEFLLPQWSMALMLGVVGLAALVLASLGIYGVMAFFVGQRRRELAVHMALGARRADVLRLVVLRGMKLAAIGVGLGLAAAAGMQQLIASLLFQVASVDPISFIFVPVFLAAVAAAACLVPARRAARVDPMNVLRYE